MKDHISFEQCINTINSNLATACVMLRYIVRNFFIEKGPEPKDLSEDYIFLFALLNALWDEIQEASECADILKAD